MPFASHNGIRTNLNFLTKTHPPCQVMTNDGESSSYWFPMIGYKLDGFTLDRIQLTKEHGGMYFSTIILFLKLSMEKHPQGFCCKELENILQSPLSYFWGSYNIPTSKMASHIFTTTLRQEIKTQLPNILQYGFWYMSYQMSIK